MVWPTSWDGVAIAGMLGLTRLRGQRLLLVRELLWQPHPAQQVGVAWVGTKWRYDGVDSDTFQGVVPFVVRPFEPRKTTVSLASREVDVGNHRGRYVCRSLNL